MASAIDDSVWLMNVLISSMVSVLHLGEHGPVVCAALNQKRDDHAQRRCHLTASSVSTWLRA
jgi:hypothetical protein